MHALLNIGDYNTLAGHPSAGASWEGFVIENLLSVAPPRTLATFYRTAAGAEVDLILELPKGETWAVEVKLGMAPKPSRGFYQALEDIQPARSFTVYSGVERYFLKDGVEVVSLNYLMEELLR